MISHQPGSPGHQNAGTQWALPPKQAHKNEWVELWPLERAHSYDLAQFALEQDQLFAYMPFGPFYSILDIQQYIAGCEQSERSRHFVVYSVRLRRICGALGLINIYPQHGDAEIGAVWYESAAHGSEINTACVLLLLEHLFDDLGYRRAVWKCDQRNIASKQAAQSLGFISEGLFRNHLIIKGENRDTSWFSMIDSEWPEKKAQLRARISHKLKRLET